MQGSTRGAFGTAALAALLWSPHFYALESLRAAGGSLLVLQFYFVAGGATGLFLALFLSGRLKEAKLLGRRQSGFLVLAASGGYGFWILGALAVETLGPGRAWFVFCSVPVLIGLLSGFGREPVGRRLFVALLVGLAGSYMMAKGQRWAAPGGALAAGAWTSRGFVLALGAGTCWAIFSLVARPVMREEKGLPAAVLVTCIGLACLLATCLGMDVHVFTIKPAHLLRAVVTGFFTVGVMTALWLRSVGSTPATVVSPFWYLGMVFGLLWAFGAPAVDLSFWWTVGGVVLILWSLRSAGARGRERRRLTMSDIIRGT